MRSTALKAQQHSVWLPPSNAGKSLTFQFPPYARSRCFTVVVGPLLALMKDQVQQRTAAHTHHATLHAAQQGARKLVLRALRLHCPHAVQVEKCLDLGLDASVYNSDCTEQQKRSLLSDLVSEDPSVRLVYTTPESLMQPRLRDALKVVI